MGWTGLVVWKAWEMGDEKLTKRLDAQKVQEYVRRGRSRTRWKDCVKRDVEK